MSRRIGERVKQVLAAVEQLGEATGKDVSVCLGLNLEAAHRYCYRSVQYGFMTRTDNRYSVVSGWREMVEKPRFHPSPKLKKVEIPRINSVFALGGL